jgi:glycosyltransferase involved in cell wall biosynthesis
LRRHDPPPWRKLFRRLERLRAIEPRSGDVVFVPGIGWASERRTNYLAEVQKRLPIHVHWIIYDLIPVIHPEFTTENNARSFRAWIDTALSLPGQFLCISRFTKEQLMTYAAEKGRTIDAVPVPLAQEFSTVEPAMRDSLRYLENERFVLSVGTLEIRKNHLTLARLWERLYRDMGDSTPILVLAGAPGWVIGRLSDYLRATGNVFGQVVRIKDASDAELAWLYSHCEFTVYPSVYEGWGLPVGESFWFGKPCICYRHSSLPEVGGDYAVYCDPDDRGSLERAVRTALAGEFAARPPARSKLRTWDMVVTETVEAIQGYIPSRS